ncbi:MAG: hypothetical protein ACPGYT_11880 [Nitrospirales bacterium]
MNIDSGKLEAANKVLASFAKAQLESRRGGVYVLFSNKARRWQCVRGNDHFAVWHRIYPGGGTSMTALSQLVRWIQGKPVFPLATWQYWASDSVKLGNPDNCCVLEKAGYPVVAPCVLCGEKLLKRYDWWSLDGVSGPCCWYDAGCRQKLNSCH